MSADECQEPAERVRLRAAMYVDGFNMYHAIDDLEQPHLKWLNLWKLAQNIIPSADEFLVKVLYCSAYYPGDPKKRWRHDQYLNALESAGVTCELGHYVHEDMSCRGCGRTWKKPTEKEGDLNVALHLLNDAWLDVFDCAYLVSADSDQAATARLFRHQFPGKKLISVSPPGRNFSHHIAQHLGAGVALNEGHIARNLFGPVAVDGSGQNLHGRRPREWDPPAAA